jgi:biotin carboxyl carrier protein
VLGRGRRRRAARRRGGVVEDAARRFGRKVNAMQIVRLAVLAVALSVGVAAHPGLITSASARVTIYATLSGQVLPGRLVTLGQLVHQGDPLMFVRSVTNAAALAAVASTSGIVTQVFVSAGQFVHAGDAVAVIEAEGGRTGLSPLRGVPRVRRVAL